MDQIVSALSLVVLVILVGWIFKPRRKPWEKPTGEAVPSSIEWEKAAHDSADAANARLRAVETSHVSRANLAGTSDLIASLGHGVPNNSSAPKEPKSGYGSMTKKEFWAWLIGIYFISVVTVMFKATSQNGGLVIMNQYQLLALLALPIAWGILPLLVGIGWLAIKKFDLSAAKPVLIFVSIVYLILCSSRPRSDAVEFAGW